MAIGGTSANLQITDEELGRVECEAGLTVGNSLSGSIAVNGSVAYSAQKAWIMAGSVKENILFESPFDPSRFARVCAACALTEDLQRLADGEETEIGEKGVCARACVCARV